MGLPYPVNYAGSGMYPEDALKSVGRRASGKIGFAEDSPESSPWLSGRGAAHDLRGLHPRSTTRRPDASHATRVRAVAGGAPECSPAARPVGPTVEARDLSSGRLERGGPLALLLGGEPSYSLMRDVGRNRVTTLKLSIPNVVADAPKLRDDPEAAAVDREYFITCTVRDEDVW